MIKKTWGAMILDDSGVSDGLDRWKKTYEVQSTCGEYIFSRALVAIAIGVVDLSVSDE